MSEYLLEICCDSVQSALVAAENGADRIELCENLYQGGLTPSAGKIQALIDRLEIPLHILIRPRKADFLYDKVEIETMLRDIRFVNKIGVDGVVIGCLTQAGEIDVSLAEWLIKEAEGMSVTFHRAFDMCKDPIKAIDQLVKLGVDRILTSGQKVNALQGKDNLKRFAAHAQQRIGIMLCGELLPDNIERLLDIEGIFEYHSAARKLVQSAMAFRGITNMGDESVSEEYNWHVVDPILVKGMSDILRSS